MRLSQWATLGLLSLVTADSNLTHESRNILPSTFKPPQHFRNVNLVRNINLEKNYVRETVNVVIENIDKTAQSEYFLPFEPETIARVGGLEVRDKKDPEKRGFSAELAVTDGSRYVLRNARWFEMLRLIVSQLYTILQDHSTGTLRTKGTAYAFHYILDSLLPHSFTRANRPDGQAIRPLHFLRLRTFRVHYSEAKDEAEVADNRRS